MNVVLLNQFYPPAQAPTGRLLADLAEALVERGHEVTVITSAGEYGGAVAAGEPPPPAGRVIHAGPRVRHRSGVGAKLGDYLSFYRAARRVLARLPSAPDVLVCMTTPPFIGLLAAHEWKRRKVPYVLWCMDLYPEALQANGFLREWNPLTPLLKRLSHVERRGASAVIALGADMAARLSAGGAERVETVPVWSSMLPTPEHVKAAQELRRVRGWGDDEIVCLYSGNMGRAHRADEFAAWAEQVRARTPRCRFVFSGDGPLRKTWERQWGDLFEFMPAVPADLCAVHLLSADIHLVSQQPEWMGVVVPSKFQAACALGRPVLFAGPAESAVGTWIQESGAGWILPPATEPPLDAALSGVLDASVRTKKGQEAFRLFEQQFTREGNCARIIKQIERTAKEPQ
jgi:putative colanic acid biosynthesis glycosyltransferase WcaI